MGLNLEPTQDFDSPGDALAHYGVKGMKWGQRKNRIVSARKASIARGAEAYDKEQAFLKARKETGETSARTTKAKAELVTALRKQEENNLTANTLTRGEQAAVLLVGGPLGAAFIVGNKVATRDSKKIKTPDIDKIYRNFDPED